jgi:hypothetical protein
MFSLKNDHCSCIKQDLASFSDNEYRYSCTDIIRPQTGFRTRKSGQNSHAVRPSPRADTKGVCGGGGLTCVHTHNILNNMHNNSVPPDGLYLQYPAPGHCVRIIGTQIGKDFGHIRCMHAGNYTCAFTVPTHPLPHPPPHPPPPAIFIIIILVTIKCHISSASQLNVTKSTLIL